MLPRAPLKQKLTDLAADGFIQLMSWSPSRPLGWTLVVPVRLVPVMVQLRNATEGRAY